MKLATDGLRNNKIISRWIERGPNKIMISTKFTPEERSETTYTPDKCLLSQRQKLAGVWLTRNLVDFMIMTYGLKSLKKSKYLICSCTFS